MPRRTSSTCRTCCSSRRRFTRSSRCSPRRRPSRRSDARHRSSDRRRPGLSFRLNRAYPHAKRQARRRHSRAAAHKMQCPFPRETRHEPHQLLDLPPLSRRIRIGRVRRLPVPASRSRDGRPQCEAAPDHSGRLSCGRREDDDQDLRGGVAVGRERAVAHLPAESLQPERPEDRTRHRHRLRLGREGAHRHQLSRRQGRGPGAGHALGSFHLERLPGQVRRDERPRGHLDRRPGRQAQTAADRRVVEAQGGPEDVRDRQSLRPRPDADDRHRLRARPRDRGRQRPNT